jgi:hypothetical protein
MPTTDIEKARGVFRGAGLTFPTIPVEIEARLKQQGDWLFTTRKIEMSPYNLQHYVAEVDETDVEDYAVLSHSGHGINSYALQYYLVRGAFRMFLHLGWGGAYMDDEAAKINIRNCFALADQIVPATQGVGRFRAGEHLTVVGSDFYGSYWLSPGNSHREKNVGHKDPVAILTEVLNWLVSSERSEVTQ